MFSPNLRGARFTAVAVASALGVSIACLVVIGLFFAHPTVPNRSPLPLGSVDPLSTQSTALRAASGEPIESLVSPAQPATAPITTPAAPGTPPMAVPRRSDAAPLNSTGSASAAQQSTAPRAAPSAPAQQPANCPTNWPIAALLAAPSPAPSDIAVPSPAPSDILAHCPTATAR